jgi:hypothetical protein
MSNTLNLYDISFENRTSSYNWNSKIALSKTNGWIANLLNSIPWLSICDQILEEIAYAETHQGYSDTVAMDGASLEISSPNSLINDDEILTTDLKEIIIEWKNFLESPPLNMQDIQ